MTAQSLEEWFSTALGQYVLKRELAYFDHAVADVFGFNAVQLGLAGCDFLRACRIPLRFTAGVEPEAGLRTDLRHLPLATASIDLAVLPHVLEFSDHPHQILREVERVLLPEGQVIVSGFNPLSMWGARQGLARRSQEFPWCGSFIALSRLKDWLALLGFEVIGGGFNCYAPPVSSEKWLSRFTFLEKAGDRWWPISGGVYFLRAVKRVIGMRVIKPGWNARAAKKSLAPVAQRMNGEVPPIAACLSGEPACQDAEEKGA